MINILLYSYRNDPKVGDFFDECSEEIKGYLALDERVGQKKIKQLTDEDLSHETLKDFQTEIKNQGNERFIFLAYCHGSQTALHFKEKQIVNISNHSKSFPNSFVYAQACHSAYYLGDFLVKEGCLSYWGYIEKINIVRLYSDIFIKYQNFGIKKFFEGDSLNEAFLRTRNYITNKIDELADKAFAGIGSEQSDDYLVVATLLQQALGAMVLLGDKFLTLQDLRKKQ